MGSPDFSVPILDALLQAGHQILMVYCQPPRPAGRGQQPRLSPVHLRALALGIPVSTPVSLKAEDAQQAFAGLKADAAVVAAYGLILPKAVLEAPRYGCFNVHASLLPRWRGAAPIQRAILSGDSETGITIMQMDQGLDTGDMLLQEALPIGPTTDAGQLHDVLSAMGARLMVEGLAQLQSGRLRRTVQPADGVTYAAKLSKDEARLVWQESAETLARQVRAFHPWPGAWFEFKGERFKLLAAEMVSGQGQPGLVLDQALTVACGRNALRLLRIQRSGRAPMDAASLLRGYDLPSGCLLG